MLRVDLPYPHKLLWPNGRTRNFHAKAKETGKHRDWAITATLVGLYATPIAFDPARAVAVRLIVSRKAAGVYPDKDNCSAAAKAYLDGIAQRLRLNDRIFEAPIVEFISEITGRFVFELSQEAAP